MDDSTRPRKTIVGEVIGLQFEPEDIHIMRLNEAEEEFDARIEEYVEIEEPEAGLINVEEEEMKKQPLTYNMEPYFLWIVLFVPYQSL